MTERRIHGVLDTRSLVDIALLMVQEGKAIEMSQGCHYDYFALLSGQDFPIKPIMWIENQLNLLYPKPLIDCTPYDESNWLFYKFRNHRTALQMHNRINEMHGVIRKIARGVELVYSSATRYLLPSPRERLQKMDINLYGGSAWWILPDKVIDFILGEINKDYAAFLLNETFTPEESFFQIVTMKSPLKTLVDINPIDMIEQNCKTWAFFSGEGKPFVGHPYVFTCDEFDLLEKSDRWFARKFDMTVDEQVLEKLFLRALVDSENAVYRD